MAGFDADAMVHRVNHTLEVEDCFGRLVRLDRSNWEKHIERGLHLEVVPYHDQFPVLLKDPDVVIAAERDGHYHFYRKGLTSGRYRDHYLHAVVVYDADWSTGKIRTWWLTRVVERGHIVWPKP